MRLTFFVLLLASALDAQAPSPAVARSAPTPRSAAELVDSAMSRMGGIDALRGIRRVRTEHMVQWLNIRLDGQLHADAPSYNWNTELRDYDRRSYRKTRRQSFGFSMAAPWPSFVDVVQDTVGMRRQGAGAWVPIHTAYVDERREFFAIAPERLLPAARTAPDLALATDTVLGGMRYSRVIASVEGFKMTLAFRTDGLLAMARFRAAQPNDGGLAPFGNMWVEIWYSVWRQFPVVGSAPMTYPAQSDVYRVGQPYQRISIMAAEFNGAAAPDSFAISDSLREAFLGGPTSRPMWAFTPVDSAVVTNGHFASTSRRRGATPLAVLIGTSWVMLEGASAMDERKLHVEWLERQVPGSKVRAGVVTSPTGLGGGTGWLVSRGVPVYVNAIAAPGVATISDNWGFRERGTTVTSGRWFRIEKDSLWIEPVAIPGVPSTLMVYSPALKWLYTQPGALPVQQELLLALVRKRGWKVDSYGSARGVAEPVSAAPPGAIGTPPAAPR